VVGALDAATGGDWAGQWSEQTGWSIERIKAVNEAPGAGRVWATYLNGAYLNAAPCTQAVADGDSILFFPRCTTATAQCFSGGPLRIDVPPTTGLGAPLSVQVWETTTTFNDAGIGTSQLLPGVKATVFGPNGSAATDQYFGVGVLMFTEPGPAVVSASRAGRVPDRAEVCVTDGTDGFCGTSVSPHVPFDPLAFCQTSGDDGLCNTVDKRGPTGHINTPAQAKTFAATARPRFLRGTVDSDPSQVEEVRLRLLRQSRILVTKVVTRKVTVKRRVNGKIVTKRVRRKMRVRVRQTTCYLWNAPKSDWRRLKSCKVVPNEWFKADGAEVWSYEFLQALPGGRYTLDAKAVDGAGNVDGATELGRNRVTFTVG
jgi:hypothetical protein